MDDLGQIWTKASTASLDERTQGKALWVSWHWEIQPPAHHHQTHLAQRLPHQTGCTQGTNTWNHQRKPSEMSSSSPVLRGPGMEHRVVRGPCQAAKTPRKGQQSSPAHVDLLPLLWLCFSFWNDRWRWEFHVFRDVKHQVLCHSERLLWV